MKRQRDTTITICKAIAIILMVTAHTDGHSFLTRFIFEFHMPLFFICSGWFFSLKYLRQEGDFVRRRFRGLYVPFVKWAVFFLVIHNLLFRAGILNERYGNAAGGVLHPYTWHEAQQRFWDIIFSMGGYDEFLAGAFWFFRALFVASILFLILFKLGVWLGDRLSRRKLEPLLTHPRLIADSRRVRWTVVAVCLLLFALCMWKTGSRLRIPTLVQGGYRDLLGCFFFGGGFLLRPALRRLPTAWWVDVLCLGIVLAFAVWSPANMGLNSGPVQCLSLPIPAVGGFILTYNISRRLDKLRPANTVRRFLVFCGDNTLVIFVWHICAFKAVSALKILYYHLDWAQIGCHLTIHDHPDDLFWVAYTVAGVAIPLLGKWISTSFCRHAA